MTEINIAILNDLRKILVIVRVGIFYTIQAGAFLVTFRNQKGFLYTVINSEKIDFPFCILEIVA